MAAHKLLETHTGAEQHHRVANNLALIVANVKTQAARLARKERTFEAAEVSGLLKEIASRIDTVARLHHLLSLQPTTPTVRIEPFLREVCETLSASLLYSGSLEFTAASEGAGSEGWDEVPIETALPIALIVTEAVTNAIKYAHPTGLPAHVKVTCRGDTQSACVVEVVDDGVGLPDGFDPETDGSLGLRTMQVLAQQVGADLVFASEPCGLRCALRLSTAPNPGA